MSSHKVALQTERAQVAKQDLHSDIDSVHLPMEYQGFPDSELSVLE